MCGLFGIVGTKLADADELAAAFATLATLNIERGSDSHGVWHGGRILARAVGTPQDVYAMAREALNTRAGVPLCGHTRLATRGAASSDNAHPFTGEASCGARYIAAHNGCVQPSAIASPNVEEAYIAHEVDSAAFFATVLSGKAKANAWDGYGVFVWTLLSGRGRVTPSGVVHLGLAGSSYELSVATVRREESGPVTAWSSDAGHLAAVLRGVFRPGRTQWHTLSAGYWHVSAEGVQAQDDTYAFRAIEPRRLSRLLGYDTKLTTLDLDSARRFESGRFAASCMPWARERGRERERSERFVIRRKKS